MIDWIIENLSGTIIYKDFNIGDLNFVSPHELNKKIIPFFDIKELKDETYFSSKDAKTTPEKILSILLNSNVRRGAMSVIKEYIPSFKDAINKLIQNDQPITLILPAMPHKKQNPITTGHSIDFIDLGECLCFQQLKNIIHSISKVYAQGARIILIPDGIALAHIFARNDIAGVALYRNKLYKVAEQLGMSKSLDILDLQSVISVNADFLKIKKEINQHLRELESLNKEVRKGLNIMKKAMLFNIPFPYSVDEYISLMKLPMNEMPSDILQQLEFTTFEYISILLTLKRLNLLKNAFPDAIRISVHCKNTPNIPINLINDTTQIFPYNGIPAVRMQKYLRNKNIRVSTRIMRLYEIYKYPSATEVYIEGQEEPFYYEIESLCESVN